MKLRILITILIFGTARFAFADYASLAKQLEARDAQKIATQRQAEYGSNIQNFNQKITSMVMSFGRAHGFASGVPAPTMNDLLPGRILKYAFSTTDGYECEAIPGDLSGYRRTNNNPAILSCIQNGTLKHIIVSR